MSLLLLALGTFSSLYVTDSFLPSITPSVQLVHLVGYANLWEPKRSQQCWAWLVSTVVQAAWDTVSACCFRMEQVERELCCNSFEGCLIGSGGLDLEAKTFGTSVKSGSKVFFYHCLQNLCRLKGFHTIFLLLLLKEIWNTDLKAVSTNYDRLCVTNARVLFGISFYVENCGSNCIFLITLFWRQGIKR